MVNWEEIEFFTLTGHSGGEGDGRGIIVRCHAVRTLAPLSSTPRSTPINRATLYLQAVAATRQAGNPYSSLLSPQIWQTLNGLRGRKERGAWPEANNTPVSSILFAFSRAFLEAPSQLLTPRKNPGGIEKKAQTTEKGRKKFCRKFLPSSRPQHPSWSGSKNPSSTPEGEGKERNASGPSTLSQDQ